MKKTILGKMVSGTIDRPLGSAHPEYPTMIYPINYGYVDGVVGGDGEEQDIYLLGEDRPVTTFEGKVIAIVIRQDDIEEKWVVSKDGKTYSKEEINEKIHFQEKYFDSEIIME